MKRGDIVTVAAQSDFGKPRPAVVIQVDALNQTDTASTMLPLMNGTLRDAPLLRLITEPNAKNNLQKTSQIMVDKLMTVRRRKISPAIGKLSDRQLTELNRLLALVIGIA